ncbi:MAG: undecaprenyl-diphosphate phosphatase [Planctomycetota bacterium]|jgi:undecaprenyl-diphosphatase|nr:undecaprenyl-diphosphate phosphatase [Planctomycetota bacterium]MDP6762863.1 undecaprenyl-diphosphate phosphatase [Planctomycetota bacterium]MDP6988741.1 undecaprenyl-diphosphate phosphatase [Planctomycetota bacterium]
MEWWEALVLGAVEGLTEYLPVSSTGHLLLVQRVLGLEAGGAANAYAICIQAGAILAVAGLYRRRVAQMARGLGGGDAEGARLLACIATAFVPAAVVGLLFDEWIEARLFGLWPIVASWFVGGALILLVGRARRAPTAGVGLDLGSLRPSAALLIGLAQTLALWPGTSRSLVTIVGGLLVGLTLSAAVEFSFLLGLATLLAATAYKALDHGGELLSAFGPTNLMIGLLSAWVFAVVSVRWMIAWLERHGLGLFGWYRVALAVVVGVALWAGKLPA